MTRISPLPDLSESQGSARGPAAPALHLGLAAIGCSVGLGMAWLVYRRIADLGTGAPVVHDLLALDAPRGATASFGAAAVDSGSQLLLFAAVVCATAAAVLLLLGSGLALAGPAHRRMAHRLTTTGLWIALSICLAAMLPMDGSPLALGLTDGSLGTQRAVAQWHPGLRLLAIGAGCGLLLSSITAGPRRRAARSAPRV